MNFLDVNGSSQKKKNKKATISILGGLSTFFGICAAVMLHAGFPNIVPDTFDHIAGTAREVVEKTLPLNLNLSANAQGEGGAVIKPEPPKLPERTGVLPQAETFGAVSVLVKDSKTGMTLYAKDPYRVHPIASITKLMSALVVLENNPVWTATTTVIADIGFDSHMYVGDTYTVQELWNAALSGSSNKAIITLAGTIGLSEEDFVNRMNQKAREFGMTDTIFVEPSGLNAGNISTASDVAILLEEAMKHEEIRSAATLKEQRLYSAERKKQHHFWNTNWLMLGWIPHEFTTIIGGKTGYIPEANYNFTVQLVDARGHIVDVVVLGAKEYNARFTEARDVAMAVYENYRWPGDETIPTSTDVGIIHEE